MGQIARGVRNGNPLNIRINPHNKWQGLKPVQDDPDFCCFLNASWGFRAAAVIIIKYYDSGLDTISKIIYRWAPGVENDTGAYIRDVCGRTGFDKDEVINVHDYNTIAPILRAMCIHENGSFPYSMTDLNAGLLKAGVVPPKKPLAKTGAARASAVGVIAGGATAVNSVNDAIDKAQPAIGLMQSLADYTPAALSFIAVGVIGFMLWDYLQKRKASS